MHTTLWSWSFFPFIGTCLSLGTMNGGNNPPSGPGHSQTGLTPLSRPWTHQNTLQKGSPLYSPCSGTNFAKKLSNYDPQKFPCSGQVLASVCAVLELLFGSIYGPGIDKHLACVNCSKTSQMSHNFPLLTLPVFHHNFRLKTDLQFIPSATLLACYINSLTIPSTSSLCMACLHKTT